MSDERIRDNQIKSINNIHQDEHQDSADAKRVTLVNLDGTANSPDNPIYVQLSDGSIQIGTVNAELEVQLSHKNNYPDAGDVADSVRIGDGKDEMAVNDDGSINVNITKTNPNADIINSYNAVTAVPSSTPTTIVSYTAPVGVAAFLQHVQVSGENIAEYEVKLNGNVIAKKRTYFTHYNTEFSFKADPGSNGLQLAVGDVVSVVVTHVRAAAGNFDARIQSIEVA